MTGFSALAGELRHDNLWSQVSPRGFPLGRIDVWRVRLDEPGRTGSEVAILSPDEAARATRFHFDRDRIHFSRCRSALRYLLSDYVAIPPNKLRFEYQAGGKPHLAGELNPQALQFSVSHSGGMSLIAVTSVVRLGVDIERMRDDVDTASLAERFFSLREREGLRVLPENLRVPGFYACWTRKESFLKATGDGLSFPLANFSVTTSPDRRPEIEEIEGSAEAGKQWFLSDLAGIKGYRATVAIEGSNSPVGTYAFN